MDGSLVISRHFPFKDVVHHPMETMINKMDVSGSRNVFLASCTITYHDVIIHVDCQKRVACFLDSRDHVFLLGLGSKCEVNRVLADALKSRQDYQDVSDDSHICSFAEWAC